MTPPILYGAPWLWTNNVDPETNVPTDNGYIGQYNLWINTTTLGWWICTDAGDWQNNSLVWQFLFFQPGVSSYSDQLSLGFNTSRRPSLTNNTQLSVSVTLTNTLLTTSAVQIEISPDNSSFEVIATMGNLTEAVSSNTYSANPIIPAGYYYKIVTSGSGAKTLVNLQEFSI